MFALLMCPFSLYNQPLIGSLSHLLQTSLRITSQTHSSSKLFSRIAFSVAKNRKNKNSYLFLSFSALCLCFSLCLLKYQARMNILHFFFGVCGNATALFLFLAPTVTFKRIIKNKSTQQFSGIPYVMTLLNCLLSCWYGLPFVSPNNILVATINGTGAAIETVYVLMFLMFAPRREKVKIGGLFVFVLAVFSAVVLISLLALHGHPRKLFCGFAATIFSIIMYGSPLSIMRMVIKTKSVEYMPFLLSLFVFLCGTSWFIYGLIGRDPFVAVPNGFGCGLGALQLILYFIYYDKNKKTTDDNAIEMGPEKSPYQAQEQAQAQVKRSDKGSQNGRV